MDRSGARELAFKLLYSLEIQKPENIEEQILRTKEKKNKEKQRIKILLIFLSVDLQVESHEAHPILS